MKNKLLLTILLLASLAGYGQTKSAIQSNQKLIIGTSTNLVPSYLSVGVNNNKPYLRINGLPSWNNPDSLILYTNKKQTYWLNDSTLIIKKP